MATCTKNNLLFLFLGNVLLFSVVHVQGRVPNPTQDQVQLSIIPVNDAEEDDLLKGSNVTQDANPTAQNFGTVGTLQDSGNDNAVANVDDTKNDVFSNQNDAQLLNVIRNLLGLNQSSDGDNGNSLGITIVPVSGSQDDGSQNNSTAENKENTPEETAPTSTAIQEVAPSTPTQGENSSDDSIGITIIPIAQEDSSQNTIPAENVQPTQNESTKVTEQAPNAAPTTENDHVPNQAGENDANTGGNSATDQGVSIGCGNMPTDDSSSKLQLDQVTVSQILYHLKKQYDQLNLKLSNGDEVVEITQKQKTFLKEMLLSEKSTSGNNKNIVSTTYAAYYSAEYTYTFALCKLHHITKGNEDEQNPVHAEMSSKCSQIMETFSSFNMSYSETISAVIESGKDQVLNYGDDADKTASTVGDIQQNLNTNPSNKKISTTNDETIQRQNLEKDLHGYNDDSFYNRVRSEGSDMDQYDLKQNQQIGDSTYSNETKGKKSDSSTYLLSDVREIPKNKPVDDPTNEARQLKKMSNTLRISSEADTRGHVENGKITTQVEYRLFTYDNSFIVDSDTETDSDRLQQYDQTRKELDQLERNYFDDDNNDVGGNIKNAKLQDVESHYSAVTEHIRDVDEQVTKPKAKKTNTTSKKFVFKQAVEKVMTLIKILHVFTEKMDETVADKKGEDAFKEMHLDIYEKTKTYRQYLKEYFASTNVGSGTFSDDQSTIVEAEKETDILQTTTDERFSWLKNADMQGQANSQSTSGGDLNTSNPITLLWYFEEASFYLEHFKQTETNVPFMSYLPYPDFDVKANSNAQDGADIQFYLN